MTLPNQKTAEAQGLFHKFNVTRTDGSSDPGGKHHGCEYFVLDVDHDPYAKAALQAYALSCEATHPQLSADLIERHGVQPQAQGNEGLKKFLSAAKDAGITHWNEYLTDQLVAVSSAIADSDDRAAQTMLSETLKLLAEPQAHKPVATLADALHFFTEDERLVLWKIGGYTDSEIATITLAVFAKLPPPQASEPAWLPIESAPKEGQLIVAKGNNLGDAENGQHHCIAKWYQGCWMESSDWNATSELLYLTHWMPLPAAPEATTPEAL